ncbi:hypothetical protein IFM47457_05523 [Aspergillus lentulus]|nr:hypothetical protein IFM47457_05523 [Aspergillus lentulus]
MTDRLLIVESRGKMASELYFLPLNLVARQRPSLSAAWFTSIHRDAGETENTDVSIADPTPVMGK